MEKRLSKNAVALSLAMFLLGGVAGFFAGYPIGKSGADLGLFPTADGGGMLLGEVQDDGIAMTAKAIDQEDYDEYGIMPIAESAQQVTATVTPADAEDANGTLLWSVTWANGSTFTNGSWTGGSTVTVTDYVTVQETHGGSRTANVQCLKAFGEQIIITVTLAANPSVKGTCTCDYEKKFLGVRAVDNVHHYNYDITEENSPDIIVGTADYAPLLFSLSYSVHTVSNDDEERSIGLRVVYNSGYLTEAKKYVASDGSVTADFDHMTFAGTDIRLRMDDLYVMAFSANADRIATIRTALRSWVNNQYHYAHWSFCSLEVTVRDSMSEVFFQKSVKLTS